MSSMNKYAETLREAKGTVAALVTLIVFWLLAGIIGSGIEVSVFKVPLWAILGTLGVWTFAIFLATTLSRNIKDTDL